MPGRLGSGIRLDKRGLLGTRSLRCCLIGLALRCFQEHCLSSRDLSPCLSHRGLWLEQVALSGVEQRFSAASLRKGKS